MYKYFLAMSLSLMLAGCAGGDTKETGGTDGGGGPQPESVAENLSAPWMIEKIEDSFYISGRNGELTLVTAEGKEEQTVDLSEPVDGESEGGQLGFVLHPEDPDKGFLYYSYQDGGAKNRVVELARDGDTWNESNVIVEDIPGGRVHNGGRLEIGPDGYLYITTGDAGDEEASQDTGSLAGKILRMNLDGTVPRDNPFDNEVYSYGHRNPQGIAWDGDGNMYAAEHGSSAHDEINRIEAGNNYGWPEIEGDEEADGMETPLHHTGEETWAPSGMAYHEGSLYIAALRGERIISFDLETGGAETFYDEGSRFRDVYIEGDTLYAITNNTDGRGQPEADDDRLLEFDLE